MRNILSSRYCLKVPQDCPYIPVSVYLDTVGLDSKTPFRNLMTVE